MRFSFQKVLTLLGICLVISIAVSALMYRAAETPNEVPLDFPGALVLQIRDETKTSTMTMVITNAGKEWFALSENLVVTDSPLRLTTHDLANGILTDAVRSNFSTLLQYEGVDVWQIEANALAAIVEIVGGYNIEGQTLNGQQAIETLRFGTSGDVERFRDMWKYLVLKLDAGQLFEILANLGSTSRSNQPIEKLISYFGSMQATYQSNSIRVREVKAIEGSVNGRIGLYLREKSRLAIIKAIEEGSS